MMWHSTHTYKELSKHSAEVGGEVNTGWEQLRLSCAAEQPQFVSESGETCGNYV